MHIVCTGRYCGYFYTAVGVKTAGMPRKCPRCGSPLRPKG